MRLFSTSGMTHRYSVPGAPQVPCTRYLVLGPGWEWPHRLLTSFWGGSFEGRSCLLTGTSFRICCIISGLWAKSDGWYQNAVSAKVT